MLKWGARSGLAVFVAAAMALVATMVVSSASAVPNGGLVSGGLTLTVDRTGPSEIMVQVEGCPKGSAVRFLIDGRTVGSDQTVPQSGRLITKLTIPAGFTGATVKAWCWATTSFVIKDIPPAVPTDPGNGGSGGDDVSVFDGRTCKFVSGPGFGGLNVVGDTFVADQNYGFVALFYSVSPLRWDAFFDVETGDELVASGPILKLGLCDPKGKPGYTPGGLVVDAFFGPGKKSVKFKVLGCPAGGQVEIFVDGVSYGFFEVPAGDTLFDFVEVPQGPASGRTLKAICNGTTFAIVSIRPSENGQADKDTALSAGAVIALSGGASSGGTSSGGAATDAAPVNESPVDTGEAGQQALAAQIAAAGSDKITLDLPTEVTILAPEAGVPEGGVEGLGQRLVVNPASQLVNTGSGTLGGGTDVPLLQWGLGVLSAAGLLAFVGLRRASRLLQPLV